MNRRSTKFKRVAFILRVLLASCSGSFSQQITHGELIEILGIRSWRVPSPRHENRQWSIEIVDCTSRKFDKSFNVKQLDPQKNALIVLQNMGEDTYRFSLKQRDGMSQGEFKINLCSAHKPAEGEDCKESYGIEWYAIPKPFDNGTRFLLAEINQMVQKKYRQQIILELAIIRPE
jgi:hypothetical protein